MIELPPDFRDLLTFLNDEKVEYMVIGGYAVNHYAEPRTTKDIDLWFSDASDNLARLAQALRRFGFSERILAQPLFAKPNEIKRFGVVPLMVELFLTIPGVTFAECYPRRTIIDSENLRISILSLKDLRASKQAAGRPRDIADLHELPPA